MNLKNYWGKAVSFDEYFAESERRAKNPATPDDYKEYYTLGVQRMQRAIKSYKPDSELLRQLDETDFKGNILIISEPWCGDASGTIPAVVKFFEGRNAVKIFFRDTDTSLIDKFLTNGAQAIPIVIILDENFDVKGSWGPRPEFARKLQEKFKADPEKYPREEFYNDLQVYYAKNKGRDAISEILEKLHQ